VRLRDLNSFALAAYRGIPTSISIATTLRSEGHPSPRKTRFRLLAKLCRAGFVNPQGRDERFLCSSHFLLSRAFLTQRHPSFFSDQEVE
jgi:hypothetical protein